MPAETTVAPATREATASRPVLVEKGRHRFLVLDGVRGLAIIGVLLTHGSYLIQSRVMARLFEVGWTGVDLFFVLSGFLITGILIDSKLAVNKGTSFYARRILRIFPIYYLTLGVVLIARTQSAWVASVADMPTLLDRLSYVFYFKNLAPLWHHGHASQTLLAHFWSLAVEEQFYFVWPLVVWHLSTKAVYRLCGIALCFALALRFFGGMHFGYGSWIDFFPLTRADGLFVGSALAAILASNHRFSKRLLAGIALPCVVALGVVAMTGYHQFFYGGPYMYTIGYSSIALLFGVLVAYCLEFNNAGLSRMLQVKWLRGFGRYSYGLYVFHLPIYFLCDHIAKDILSINLPLRGAYSFLYLGLLIAISYGIAWVSFNFFEQRFLRLKRHFEPEFPEAALVPEPTA
jgi:peptidoglycan/LPS O-acetylase OafA/YrhL